MKNIQITLKQTYSCQVSDEDRQEAMVNFSPLSQLAYLCLPRDQLKALTLFGKDGAAG